MANSYKDPYWSSLSKSVERKLELPDELLSTIVSHGERSNKDQISEAGARTVYQITPQTRKLVLEKYGIDAYLSDENAAEAAGLLLKESLKRNAGDVNQAVGEYHGGTNRKNWGPRTKSYIARVSDGLESKLAEKLLAEFDNQQEVEQDQTQQSTDEEQPQQAEPDLAEQLLSEWDTQTPGWDQPQPEPKKKTGYDFGPNDSVIASSVMHPVEAAGKAADWLTKQVNTAAGIADPYDNPNPLLAPTIEQQAGAALNVAGLAQTGIVAPVAIKAVEAVAQPTKAALSNIVDKVGQKAANVADDVSPVAASQTQGVGADVLKMSEKRIADAQSLDVPIDLTRGEATRLPTHQKQEDMLARGPFGDKLHEAADIKNQKLYQNLDIVVDGTNVTDLSKESLGFKLDSVLKKKMETARLRIGAEYKKADNSPEAQLPVNLNKTIETLNSREKWHPESGDALDLTRKRLLELGAVEEKLVIENGVEKTILVPGKKISQKDVENGIYKFINNNSKTVDRVDRAKLRDIKTAINDDLTALDEISPLYAKARLANRKFIEDFESHKIIIDLTTKKLGTEDRKIAIEHVFDKTIMADNRSVADLQHLKTLLLSGKRTKEGTQVWNEIRGHFAERIKSEAFGNNTTNTMGENTISPAKLNKFVKKYSSNGKLDFILGTKDAEKVRTIADVANYIFTNPPKTVNASGTAGQLASLVADVASGGLVTGLPLPLIHMSKLAKTKIQSLKVQKEIEQILNYSKKPIGK